MSRTVLTVKSLSERNLFSAAELTSALTAAVSATDGAEVAWDGRDDKYLILSENANTSAAKTVTVKGGNGPQAGPDLTFSVPAASFALFAPDSGRFKQVSGADRGKVIFAAESADIKLAVFRLP